MDVLKSTFCVLICLAVISCAPVERSDETISSSDVRIGVYDSRAIAVACVGSDYYAQHIEPLEVAFRQAKAQGDQQLIEELGPQVWARRKETHRQAFSTAPVDDILDYIKDDLPAIASKAGVETIIPKWDKQALSQYKSAMQVEVTMLLVEAFKPNARQLESALAIQKHRPIPLEELEKHMTKDGH